jgi:hypothetical protein
VKIFIFEWSRVPWAVTLYGVNVYVDHFGTFGTSDRRYR